MRTHSATNMAATLAEELGGYALSPGSVGSLKSEGTSYVFDGLNVMSPESVGDGETVDMSAIKQEPPSNFGDDGSSDGNQDGRPAGGGKAKKISRNKDEKSCGICGDKALGCNFDAVSCESCKAFFRRNALKNKKTKCLFSGNCRIDVNTRRFCPHCRLEKCFRVGMKKDLILGDTERKKRMDKVKTNRAKKGKGGKDDPKTPEDLDALSPQSETPVASPAPSTASVGPLTPGNPQTPMTISAPTTPMPTSPGNFSIINGQAMSPPLTTSQVNTCNLLTLLSARGPSIATDVQQQQIDQNFLRKLTTEETSILSELQQVYELSFIVDLEPLVHIKHVDPTINQLVNQSSITVLRIIKFAKRLEEFTKLPQECQIGILKWTWIHILLLRSVSLYDTMRDVWVTPKGEIPSKILKNATGFVQLHEEHVTFSKSFKAIIEEDLQIVIILLAVVLFSPEGPHVTHRDVVSNIQDKYLLLLKHYLEARYSYQKAAEMYPQLMFKIKELKELGEGHGKYLLHIDPTEIEPIMLEILDLK